MIFPSVAIDPGASGGIAVRFADKSVETYKMPATVRDVADLLREIKDHPDHDMWHATAILEDVPPFAGKAQSGSSAFKLGKNCGVIEGALIALGYRVEKVRPQTWQKALGFGARNGATPTQWKNKLKARAQELYPEIKVTLWNADALLLSEYGK